jgi:hypothetical protein
MAVSDLPARPPGDSGRTRPVHDEGGAMPSEMPSGLLYLLTVGREKELVLRLHGAVPTSDELLAWMREGAVCELTVSRHHGDEGTSTLVLNFALVIGARIAPYSENRSTSF